MLNADGRRYVYGIPVYNIIQKEVSFAVTGLGGNLQTPDALQPIPIPRTPPTIPAVKTVTIAARKSPRMHTPSFSPVFFHPDYVDVTGDGISDDDIGDAVSFSYSKTSGIANPYEWRAPYITGMANYNEGLKS